MVTLTPLPTTQAITKIENHPTFALSQEVKLFNYGQHSTTYKVYGIGIYSLEQDEDYGFWEARYIYAIFDADSKFPIPNIRWEHESDLVPSDFWTKEMEF
jgi:hypothetical protein